MNNIMWCNAGRRGRLMIDMRKTIGDSGNVVATDNWSVAPAIFFANKFLKLHIQIIFKKYLVFVRKKILKLFLL